MESTSLTAAPFTCFFKRNSFTMSVVHPPSRRSPRTFRLRPLPHTLIDVPPPLRHPFSVVLQNQSKRRVMKADQCSAISLAQAVLHVRDGGIRHEQWPSDFEQRRPLDGLHHSPEVAVVVAKVAIPPAARPRLELHRHRPALSFVVRPQLLQQRGKCIV